MAGKQGMHKKLLNPSAMEVIRAKIDAEKIINKLTNHILNNDEMSSSQVSAALGLLKKTTPDLSSIEHKGDEDNPLHTITHIQLVALDDSSPG